jgi:hypothetical protein
LGGLKMSWQETLETVLGPPSSVLRPSHFEPKNPTDNIDNMDTIKAEGNSVHSVHCVHTPQGSNSIPNCELFTGADLIEGANWSPENQRVWAAAVKHFESKAYPTDQAEALALAMVCKLIERRKTRHLVLISDLSPEVAKLMGTAVEMFPGAQIELRPQTDGAENDNK